MRVSKKSIFITLTVIVPLFLIIIFSFKIYFLIGFNEKELKKIITNFCKDSLDKAVKFEDIYIDYSGDIILSNFNLSVTSDFNDNLSLIKSDVVIFHLQFTDLLKGRIVINGISLLNSDITIHNRFSGDYLINLNKIIELKGNNNKIENINFDEFEVELINNNVLYKKVFKNKKLIIEFNDIYGSAYFKKNNIAYNIKGNIKPYQTKKIKKGNFKIEGELLIKKSNPYNASIKIKNFDLSYLNDYLKEHQFGNILLTGGLTADTVMASDEKGISLKGIIETNNLNLINFTKVQYNILLNENFNIEIDFYKSKRNVNYRLSKLNFFNEIFNINISGEYLNNNDKTNFKLKFKSNKIDLNRLSDYFTPVKDISYKGKLDFDGNIDYDLEKNIANKIDVNLNLNNFNVLLYKNGIRKKIITNCNTKLNAKENDIDIKISTRILKSDFLFDSRTTIRSWFPLKSATDLNLKSKVIDIDLLFYAVYIGIENFYRMAYKDAKRGYEEIYFLQKSAGKILVNNNISFNCMAQNIFLGGKAELNDLLLKIRMKNGYLNLKEFNLTGYDASYNFQLKCFFNRDYPYFTLNGIVNSFNLGKLSADLGFSTGFSGSGFAKFDYDLTAYRISHLIENSKGNLYLSIQFGELKNSGFQNRLSKFFQKNGYGPIDLSDINFNNFSISLSQMGDKFNFRNISINSDILNFTSYGKYNYADGLKIPIYAVIRDKNKKITGIPLKIKGHLLSPELSIRNKKDSGKLLLFKVD